MSGPWASEVQRLTAEVAALRASRDRFARLSSQDQDHAVKAETERNTALRHLAERDATIARVKALCDDAEDRQDRTEPWLAVSTFRAALEVKP